MDRSRGTILSFMHHNQYDGMFASLARYGATLHVLTSPLFYDPRAGAAHRQHLRVVSSGATVVPASGGTAELAKVVCPGVTLAIASDMAGHTPVTFLGRRVLASSGAARISFLTNSPVVMVTAHRAGSGSYLQVEEPIEPGDFADPTALLDELLRRHADAVLAWPEALESPRIRFGAIDDQPAAP
ncbi:MAG: hypothetical protein ACR2LX_02680 [Jatrophihabitans sp.]